MSEFEQYKAWPYREAISILEKLEREEKAGIERKHKDVLLQTGFGPSGLPHIGTFSEVARTNWVRQAFEQLDSEGRGTRLFAFSDDMDGMRGIPLDTPIDELKEHLGKPLCDVPDPFGEHESFAGHMNAKLQEFLDSFGFEYEFKSAKDQYRDGVFNEGLKRVVDTYDEIRDLVTATLREENAETWSPFKPICEECGRNTTTRVTALDRDNYTISYACDGRFNAKIMSWEEREGYTRKQDGKSADPYWLRKERVEGCGHTGTVPVTDGHVKVGWKVDWALRWYVFGVDYEMYGKDLIDSAEVSGPIVKILGGEPPAGMSYEWFNDEHNKSISKTKGNGLTIDEWLTYGPVESLAYFVYKNPGKSKRLFREMISDKTDEYLQHRQRFGKAPEDKQINSPVWFVEADKRLSGKEVAFDSDVNFSMLLNLVGVLNTDDREVIWEYIERYDPEARQVNGAIIDSMIGCALNYYRDFIAPTKSFEAPPEEMRPALKELMEFLRDHPDADAEAIQTATYQAAKDRDLSLGKWFKSLYRLMLGQDQGPRIGSFASIYGVTETLELIEQKLFDQGAGIELP